MRKEREVQQALSEKYRSSKATGAAHDRRATSSLQPLSSEVVEVSHPSMQQLVSGPHRTRQKHHLYHPHPWNNLYSCRVPSTSMKKPLQLPTCRWM